MTPLATLLLGLVLAAPPEGTLAVTIDRGHVCLPKGATSVAFEASVRGATGEVQYAWYVRRASEPGWPSAPVVTGSRAVSLDWANYTRFLKVVVTASDGTTATDSVGIQYGGPDGAYCIDGVGPDSAVPPDVAWDVGLHVMPNPTVHHLQLVLQVSLNDVVALSIYDALGRRVRTLGRTEATSDAPFAREIDVRDLPPGVYRAVADGVYGTYSRSFTVAR